MPGGGDKRQQQGEDLQTAQQHGKGQHQLGEVRVLGKAAGRAHHVEAGADIVEAGHHGGEIGFKAERLQRDQQKRSNNAQRIERKISGGAVLGFFVDHLAFVAHHGNGAGMHHVADLVPDHLAEDHHAGDLKAAAGRTGARAHEHQQKQDRFGKAGPQIEVGGGVAGGGDDGRNLKCGVPQTLAHRFIHGCDVAGDGNHAGTHNAQIGPQLGAAQRLAETAQDHQEENVEVDTECQHADGDDPLEIRAVTGNAVGFDAETAGAGSTEGVYHAVIKRHAAGQQENDHNGGDAKINEIENAGGVLGARYQLAYDGAGHLGAQNVHGAVRHLAGDHGDQHQHAHAAYPVGEAAPEQIGAAHRFHIGENGSTGGGKTADGFEECIHIGGDLTAEHKGQRADGGEQQPADRNDGETLAGKDVALLGAAQHRHCAAQYKSHSDGDKVSACRAVVVVEADQQRQYQHGRFQQNHLTDGVDDHFIIHRANNLLKVKFPRLHMEIKPILS